MSEKEKELLQKLSETVPKLNEGNKRYLLGVADGMALMNEQQIKSNGSENVNIN